MPGSFDSCRLFKIATLPLDAARAQLLSRVKRKPQSPLHPDRFTGRAIGKQRIGMDARHERIGPHAAAVAPRRLDPALVLIACRGDRFLQNLVSIGLRVKTGCASQHHAHLRSDRGQRLSRVVLNKQFHTDGSIAGLNGCAKRDAVRQHPAGLQSAIVKTLPLRVFDGHIAIVPDGWNVRVGEKCQPEIAEDRFRKIYDYIRRRIQGRNTLALVPRSGSTAPSRNPRRGCRPPG